MKDVDHDSAEGHHEGCSHSDSGEHRRSTIEKVARAVSGNQGTDPEEVQVIAHGARSGTSSYMEPTGSFVPVAVAAALSDHPVFGMVTAGTMLLAGLAQHARADQVGTSVFEAIMAQAKHARTSVSHHGHGHGHGHKPGVAMTPAERYSHRGALVGQAAAVTGIFATTAATAAGASPLVAAGGALAGLVGLGVASHDPNDDKPRWRSVAQCLRDVPLSGGLSFMGLALAGHLEQSADVVAATMDDSMFQLGVGFLALDMAIRLGRRGVASVKNRCVARRQTHQISIERSGDNVSPQISPELAAIHRKVAELRRMTEPPRVVNESSSRPAGKPSSGGRGRFSLKRRPR